MADLSPVAPKLAKLLPRLASTHDGEVVATVRAIGRTLEGASLDWHDLAAHVGAALFKPSDHVSVEPDHGEPDWATAAREAAKARAERQTWAYDRKAFWKMAPSGLRWADMGMTVLDVLGGSLSERETDFLIRMHHETQSRHPTEKQAAWLSSLHERARRHFR